MNTERSILALALLCLAGCTAIQTARMALPAPLTRSNEVRIQGLGAAPKGQFRTPTTTGTFERSATRLSFFDDLAAIDKASSHFDLAGSDTQAAGECQMKRTTSTVKFLDVPVKPFSYTCRYTVSGASGTLAMQEAREARGLRPAERKGVLRVDQLELGVRAVFDIEQSSIPLSQPIGYIFEEGGRPVAAVQLNGTVPVMFFAPGASLPVQQAALVGSLSLALLWERGS